MAYLAASPGVIASAASDISRLGIDIKSAYQAAVSPTSAVMPAAGDEVSTAIARLFSTVGSDVQTLGARAMAAHEDFVRHLTAGASVYAAAEHSNGFQLAAAAVAATTVEVTEIASQIALTVWYGITNVIFLISQVVYAIITAIIAVIYFGFAWIQLSLTIINQLLLAQLAAAFGIVLAPSLPNLVGSLLPRMSL